jgi:hypothetical protein
MLDLVTLEWDTLADVHHLHVVVWVGSSFILVYGLSPIVFPQMHWLTLPTAA